MKQCIKCKNQKPLSEYHKDKTKRDGFVSACKQCKNKYRKKYYEENASRLKSYSSEWHKKQMKLNPEEVRLKAKIRAAKYRVKNKDRVRKNNAQWMMADYRERYKNDNEYTAARVVRRTLNNALRNIGLKKESSTWSLLGYTLRDFIKRIEPLMLDGMNWGNHGEWHIDHIKPVSVFISEGETDPKIINALDNLQPLWAKDNLSKGAKYDAE